MNSVDGVSSSFGQFVLRGPHTMRRCRGLSTCTTVWGASHEVDKRLPGLGLVQTHRYFSACPGLTKPPSPVDVTAIPTLLSLSQVDFEIACLSAPANQRVQWEAERFAKLEVSGRVLRWQGFLVCLAFAFVCHPRLFHV